MAVLGHHTKLRERDAVKLKCTVVCLFVCIATGACHLELVDDLSADHFIMALKRFIARCVETTKNIQR